MGGPRERAGAGELAAIHSRLMASGRADGEVWICAYGSLIWNPNFAHVAETVAHVHGWHRAFRLGWMRSRRGCPIAPA